MPNNFLVVGLCGRDYAKAEEAEVDYCDVDFAPLLKLDLCRQVNPLPVPLRSLVKLGDGIYRYFHKDTDELRMEVNSPMGEERHLYRSIKVSDAETSSIESEYGSAYWYDWQVNNWGTKWGTYDTKVHELGGDGSPILIEFACAWGPPNAETMRLIDDYLCATYYLQNIKWIGHDPYDNQTYEIEVAKPVEQGRANE